METLFKTSSSSPLKPSFFDRIPAALVSLSPAHRARVVRLDDLETWMGRGASLVEEALMDLALSGEIVLDNDDASAVLVVEGDRVFA